MDEKRQRTRRQGVREKCGGVYRPHAREVRVADEKRQRGNDRGLSCDGTAGTAVLRCLPNGVDFEAERGELTVVQ